MKNYKHAGFLSIKKNLLFQLFLFPLCASAALSIPAIIIAFLSNEEYLFKSFIILYIVIAIFSLIFAFLFSYKIKNVSKFKPVLNQFLIFLCPALNIVILGILYFFISIETANTAALIINPGFIFFTALGNEFFKNFVPVAMLISTTLYSLLFFIITYKKFNAAKNTEEESLNLSENTQNIENNTDIERQRLELEFKNSNDIYKLNVKNKKIRNILFTAVSFVTVLSIALSTVICLPEIEYLNLSIKYERLNFSEEVDFNFYTKFPFQNPSNVAVLDGPSTLIFNDCDVMPRIDGATAFYPMYSAFAQATYLGLGEYVKDEDMYYQGEFFLYPVKDLKNSGILCCTKTNDAYTRLINKDADIIFTFEPSQGQLQEAANKGVKLKLTKIGYDAFCFFVNKENPVNNLSLQQVQKIYTGEINNWRSVGGNDKRVFAFVRPEGSGSQTIMENVVMKDLKINSIYQSRTTYTMGGMLYVVNGYLNTPNAIGYTFMFYSSGMVTADSIKYLSIDGVLPTINTVRNGTYLFSVPFYAITREGEETQETKELLSWITGPQGQELLTKTGYVGL